MVMPCCDAHALDYTATDRGRERKVEKMLGLRILDSVTAIYDNVTWNIQNCAHEASSFHVSNIQDKAGS